MQQSTLELMPLHQAQSKPILFNTYDEKMFIEMFPMNRMGSTPQEIANGITWLCLEESSYVTGRILAIDGALQLARHSIPI
jgi:NAD(P)-dependent dehydrogenase (short-subunit alcohol dehydrogenase family)